MANALQRNEDTGFIESTSPTNRTFDGTKKVKVLELATAVAKAGDYPSVAALCDSVDISLSTFYQHLHLDSQFKSLWQEVMLRVESGLVTDLTKLSKRANGFMPIMALLRDINASRWNPQTQIIHSTDNGRTKALSDSAGQYIDAELVDNQGNTGTLKGVV